MYHSRNFGQDRLGRRGRVALAAIVVCGAMLSLHTRGQAAGGGGAADTPMTLTAASPAIVRTIAFGSCARQDKPQPIWTAVGACKPDLFLFIGDNIYGDTEDMGVMQAKYEQLGAIPEFAAFRAACPILAVWDDHDFGVNDGGAEYSKRAESQRLLLDFFAEPAESSRRHREGVYGARVFGEAPRRVQVIMLDTRYFRGPLKKRDDRGLRELGTYGSYEPDAASSSTMLGDAQWKWLDAQLRQPAEVRIIASSIQVVAEEQAFEKWENLPAERARLFDLIRATGAGGVIFVSGDRHRAEVSRFEANAGDVSRHARGVGYPLYDVTSSGLTEAGGRFMNELNRNRVGAPFLDRNFGVIAIDWERDDPEIRLEIRTERGEPAIRVDVKLSELRPKAAGGAEAASERP
jgi:alkaline phosphatase D